MPPPRRASEGRKWPPAGPPGVVKDRGFGIRSGNLLSCCCEASCVARTEAPRSPLKLNAWLVLSLFANPPLRPPPISAPCIPPPRQRSCAQPGPPGTVPRTGPRHGRALASWQGKGHRRGAEERSLSWPGQSPSCRQPNIVTGIFQPVPARPFSPRLIC